MSVRRIIAACFLACAVLPKPNIALSQDDYFYRLASASLACIIAHRDAYLDTGDGPIFIAADQCPPDDDVSLIDLLTNEAPDLTFADENELDHFLSLSRSNLECLADLTVPEDAEVVLFYPADCRIEVEADSS